MHFTVVLSLLLLALLQTEAASARHSVADQSLKKNNTLTIRIGNCVESMTFIGCADVAGTFLTQPPPTIDPMISGNFTIVIPTGGVATTGNCSWEYTNAHGVWPTFVAWNFNPLGQQDFGGGTNDAIDNEMTDFSMPLTLGSVSVACVVFAYGTDGVNQCISVTSPPSIGCTGFDSPSTIHIN